MGRRFVPGLLFGISALVFSLPGLAQTLNSHHHSPRRCGDAGFVVADGKLLAMDLQGSIHVLPVGGGEAKRVTDIFSAARQPRWAPDGKTIMFSGYREGGFDLWGVGVESSHQRQLTEGTSDDREPILCYGGTHIAFPPHRGDPLGSDNIWILDIRNGQLTEPTTNPAEDTMPA